MEKISSKLLSFAATLFAGVAVAGSNERATLVGIIKNEDGKAVNGAHVFIRTAGPRKGVGHL